MSRRDGGSWVKAAVAKHLLDIETAALSSNLWEDKTLAVPVLASLATHPIPG